MILGSNLDVGHVLEKVTMEPGFLQVPQLFPVGVILPIFHNQSLIHRHC
jgi:hypothetical protein